MTASKKEQAFFSTRIFSSLVGQKVKKKSLGKKFQQRLVFSNFLMWVKLFHA